MSKNAEVKHLEKPVSESVKEKHLIPVGEVLVGQIDFNELLAEIRF